MQRMLGNIPHLVGKEGCKEIDRGWGKKLTLDRCI